MKRIYIMIVTVLCCVLTVSAVEKLSLKDITDGKFRHQTLSGVKPLSDGVSYGMISKDGKQIVSMSFKTGKQTEVIFDANTARGPKIHYIDDYIISPDGRHILIQTETNYIYRRSFTATYYIYNVRNKTLVPLSDGGAQQTPIFSPDGNVIAFVRDNNIHLVKLLYDNAESCITTDGKRNAIINGIPDWVNEEEFGFNSAMVFSADSRQVCWIKYDETNVGTFSFPLYKGTQATPPTSPQGRLSKSPLRGEIGGASPDYFEWKYPFAGEPNSKVSVWSYDIKSHQTRKLQVPLDADGYIPRILATSDSSKVCVLTMNRHQSQLNVYMVNPLTTVSQLIISDKDDKYIKEEVVDNLIVTPQNILLPSERDGYMHLYLYSINGGQPKRVIKTGDTPIDDVYGVDDKTGDVYFSAAQLNPGDRQVYVAHANGKIDRLTQKEGVNRAIFSKNFSAFINTWSDLDTPPVVTLNDNKGKLLSTLIDNAELKKTLSNYSLGKRELLRIPNKDGVEMCAWMVKPANFDPNKKYPVMMYQYGGPGSQQVTNSWNNGQHRQGLILEQYLAQEGFISVCVDNRGTGFRGAEFEKCTYLRLGEKEAHDQADAALWLAKQSYIDGDRIGIYGWSYGGWNTLMSMSDGRGAFKAGVAIAPPTSWRYYDTVYTERFMRTPQENPDGYDSVNPMAWAKNLKGALLICHGLADDNVHFRQTAEYTDVLVDLDKDFQMMTYTNRNHSIYGGNARHHLYRQVVNFFKRELK